MGSEELTGLGDVLAERRLNFEEVHAALCGLFSLSSNDIAVIGRLEALQLVRPEVKVSCLVQFFDGGEFRTHLSPYESLSKNLPTIPLIVRLCRLLHCRCLVGDESSNPFAFYLVDGGGEYQHVGVDPVRVDAGEYVLAGWQE